MSVSALVADDIIELDAMDIDVTDLDIHVEYMNTVMAPQMWSAGTVNC